MGFLTMALVHIRLDISIVLKVEEKKKYLPCGLPVSSKHSCVFKNISIEGVVKFRKKISEYPPVTCYKQSKVLISYKSE